MILVADTYNHKIKVVDPFRNESFSWLGNGDSLLADGSTFRASFNEPSGLSSLYDEASRDVKVFVCDTNNHCIRRVLYDIGEVTTLKISGIPPASGDGSETLAETDLGSTKILNREFEEGMICENGECY